MDVVFSAIISLLYLFEIIPSISSKDVDKCSVCNDLVSTFVHGLSKTEKGNFGGGNTEWEEKSLQKYRSSEIRYHEVTDYVCKSFGNINIDKDAEHRCFDFFNKNEEDLETWYFHKQSQSPDLKTWFCISTTKVCCPDNTWGPECQPCSGQESGRPCFGRGKCDGAGTRQGTGKCICDIGYQGNLCRKCSNNYFASFQNETDITCERCNRACKSGCSGFLAKDCLNCKDGWLLVEKEGCKDVNECEKNPCNGQNEECLNLEGSFQCKCKENYKKENGVCILDVSESNEDEEENDDDGLDKLGNESFFEKEEQNLNHLIQPTKEQQRASEKAAEDTIADADQIKEAEPPKPVQNVDVKTVPTEEKISSKSEQQPQMDKKSETESVTSQRKPVIEQSGAEINNMKEKEESSSSKALPPKPTLDDKTIRERRKKVQDHLKQLMDTLENLETGKGSGENRLKNKFKYSDPEVQSIMDKLDHAKQHSGDGGGSINPSDLYKKAGTHNVEL